MDALIPPPKLSEVVDTLPAETVPRFKYVTAVSGLTLRASPTLQSEKLAVMPLGTKVTILEAAGENTMNVGSIDGAMDEIEHNGQKGYAFNGFLSQFLPGGFHGSAKDYAEALKKEFPRVVYSQVEGDSVSKPKTTQILILPTDKWHEAFFVAQQLFDIPHGFAFPNPSGANNEIQKNSVKKKTDFISELRISRDNNVLRKISYHYKTEGFGYVVAISKNANGMKISRMDVAD